MSDRPGGLYLHVPFCARVCPYCDFAVRTGDRDRRRRYTDHLLAEIVLPPPEPLTFDTIYLGGGTPSHLEAGDLARILEALGSAMRLTADTRLYLEANPEDVSPASVEAWRELGFQTLSLGVQALNEAGLEFLGRLHDAEGARRAMGLAREAGFETVSMDLIYGLPGQSEADWREEMDRALSLSPDHLSCYQLTIHAGTRFGARKRRGKLQELPEEAQGDLFRLTHRHLNDAGMRGYEVSQFAAAPEHRSRHNRKYWDHTPYRGLGPSAHSYRGDRRWWNLRATSRWEERIDAGEPPVEGSETLSREALALESLMTGLRTYDGVDLGALRRRTGLDPRETDGPLLERLQEEGRIMLEGDRITPTLEGLAVADGMATLFELGAG